MTFSANSVANAAAWIVVAMLIGVAGVVADVLGFVGLMLLGGMTWLVCVRVEMDQDAPTWGVEVFKARISSRTSSPEQRAAMLDEQRAFLSPLRFYRWCGVFLAAVGAGGFIWQQWGAGIT